MIRYKMGLKKIINPKQNISPPFYIGINSFLTRINSSKIRICNYKRNSINNFITVFGKLTIISQQADTKKEKEKLN